jgi:hypothetical protein
VNRFQFFFRDTGEWLIRFFVGTFHAQRPWKLDLYHGAVSAKKFASASGVLYYVTRFVTSRVRGKA